MENRKAELKKLGLRAQYHKEMIDLRRLCREFDLMPENSPIFHIMSANEAITGLMKNVEDLRQKLKELGLSEDEINDHTLSKTPNNNDVNFDEIILRTKLSTGYYDDADKNFN